MLIKMVASLFKAWCLLTLPSLPASPTHVTLPSFPGEAECCAGASEFLPWWSQQFPAEGTELGTEELRCHLQSDPRNNQPAAQDTQGLQEGSEGRPASRISGVL